MFTILSCQERHGVWAQPRVLNALTVMGNSVLDLRQAVFSSGDHEIRIRAVMGSVSILVPEGIAVDISCLPILGAIDVDRSIANAALPANAPRLKIMGLVVMSSLEVHSTSTALDGHTPVRALTAKREPRDH